jgi:hypothetical protein
MTLAIGLAVSPVVSYSRIAWDFHEPACLAATGLAAFAFWLTRSPRPDRALSAAVIVSALAGASLSSDPLFAVVGLIPFATTGAVLLVVLRRRFAGLVVIACSALALPTVDFERLLGLVVQVGNGNYTGTGWTQPAASATCVLSIICAGLVVAALAAPFALLARALRSRPATGGLLVWSTFWAVCVAANCLGYALSIAGTQTGYYLLAVLYATAATVPIALATTRVRRTAAGVAIGVVVAASLVNLLRTQLHPGGIATVASRIVAIARAEDAPYGYTANYEDAASLTWSTNLAVRVRAVRYCGSLVCPLSFNVLTDWYQPHDARSFIIEEPAPFYLATAAQFGPPLSTFTLGGGYAMEIYPYDVASRLDDTPGVSFGVGFDAAEPFDGSTGRWLVENGRLTIQTVAAMSVTLDTVAFSNGLSRTLELLEGGLVLGRTSVPTHAVRVQFGPFVLPAGLFSFDLVASPGPAQLGGGREGSVFLETVSAQGTPTAAG